MTDKDHLRDARLVQALQHMPDAHMQPGAQARLAVLQHAQEAVAGSVSKTPPKTRRWWQSTATSAWGGALASVLVASFITLMWYDQPVPDANPDMPAISGRAESTAPASPPVTAMVEAKPSAPPVVAQRKQESVKENRKPAVPKAAEAPPPPFIPPPEVQAAAAPPPPPPAPVAAPFARALPAPAPPPPATSPMQVAPIGSMANAAPAARARADMALAKSSPAPATKARSELIDIQSGDQLRRVPASQAAALLAYLRALPPQTAGLAAEPVTAPATAMSTPSITIHTAQGDRWDVWPTQVHVQAATRFQVFAISPLQYETLRSLIERVVAP